MPMHPSITKDRILDAVERQTISYKPGFCLACGEEAEGVQPDARRHKCEACGEKAVYGAEELLLMIA
jgi:hypothetical protein